MTAAYFLGIDGGGTNCRARVRDAEGRLIGEATGGPSNIATDPAEAIGNIAMISEAAFANGGLAASGLAQCSACFGLAGANMAGATARVEGHAWPFQGLRIEHDGIIACVGAHAGGDGAIASIGTGAVYVVSVGGTLRTFGGWGFMLSDQGSGADLGREALRRSLYARDGLIEPTAFTDAVWARFDGSVEKLQQFVEGAKPRDYGTLAPLLFQHAEKGDAIAGFIIERGQTGITLALDHIVKLGVARICLVGGIGRAYRPYLPERFKPYLTAPRHDPLDGAILLAGGRCEAADPAITEARP
ncbi:MAG TPA: BadF/BadG/BcrA/BcrD ATPase family protein [Dongiaceae bacterium]|nr:BadF/BadG/BcrA/BcrD ATPase family protein [Dongiaceae bacterium]